MLKTFLMSWVFLLAWASMAQSVSVELDEEKLQISTSNINYPPDILNIELKSGLPNTIELLIILSQEGSPLIQKIKHFSVIYDLWDEFYLIHELGTDTSTDMRVDSDKALKKVLSSLDIVIPYDPKLFDPQIPITVSAQIFFNPVQSQRVKKIQNWIRSSKGFDKFSNEDELKSDSSSPSNTSSSANNSAGRASQQTLGINTAVISLSPLSTAGSNPSSGPRFKKLFDKILEQHLSEDSIAAQWRSAPHTTKFAIKDIQNESY